MASGQYALKWQMIGGAACFAVSAYTLAPPLFPYYSRRYYQQYNPTTKLPEEVDDYTLTLANNVLERLNFPESKESKLDIFLSHDMEPRYIGSFSHRGHCLLGLPSTFKYRSVNQLDADKETLFKKNFPWSHPDAQILKESLVLEDDEKEFLICRQLGYLDTKNIWGHLLLRLLCVGSAFLLAHITNFKFGYYNQKKMSDRMNRRVNITFIGCGLVGAALTVWLNDSYNCYLDKYADKYAAAVGAEIADAGRRYYDKIMKCNIALRNIIPGTEDKFTVYGNEKSGIFRTKSLPLSARRAYMTQMSVIKETAV